MKKLAIFSLSAYYNLVSVSADWQKMNQDYNDLVYQKVEALANNTDLYDFSEDFESVVKKLTTVDLSIIQDYGCYCNFDGDGKNNRNDDFREKAKGRPLDDVDRFCKALHDGYTCAQVDAKKNGSEEEEEEENNNNNSSCIPWQTTYNSAFNNGLYHDLRMDQLSYLCKKANTQNSCAAQACQIEGWFVQSFFTYFANGGKVDLNNLKHSNGFKHKNNCFGTTKKLEELDCCNNYPLRYPFRNKEGVKKCCRSVTYNVLTHQCCEDGTVRMDCNNVDEDSSENTFTKPKKKNENTIQENNIEVLTTTEANESSIPEPIIITDLNAIGADSEIAPKSETENKHENHRIKFKNKINKQQNNKIITSKQRNHGADTL